MAGMRRVLTVLLGLAILVGLPPTAWSSDLRTVRDAIRAGGERLVDLQNADGGWFFTVGDPDCGLGADVSCPNTFGVTALGLVASYKTRDSRHLNANHLIAARITADALVATHAASPACDSNPATSADRPFTVDVSFLLDGFGKAQGKAGVVYRNTARAWFACVMADFPSAAARANNRIDGRIAQGLANLGGWDASLDIRAALAVGQHAYALAEARQVLVRQPDWDVADPDCLGCELLTKGLFLAATKPLKTDRGIQAARVRFTNDLLAAQSPDGSWGGDTQTTAYAVMGLVTMTSGRPNVRAAVAEAVDFLLSMQNGDGGFGVAVGFESTEVTEVDGEVLQGFAALFEDN